MSTLEVKVPDIGDFKDVPVIEVLVQPGTRVAAEDSLVTLESDKATMDVPAPAAGVVRELRVKVGDKVSEGSTILLLDAEGAAAPTPKAPQAPASAVAAATAQAAAPHEHPVPAPAPDPAAAAGGGATVDVKVPDIGDFKDVPVIEVLVKAGDLVNAEDSLVTLESDKATMDVPAPQSGRVRDLKVKLGDKVSEGTVILTLETSGGATPRPETPGAPVRTPSAPPPASAPDAARQAPAAPAPRRQPQRRSPPLRRPSSPKPSGPRMPRPRCASSRASSASISRESPARGRRTASCRRTCRSS